MWTPWRAAQRARAAREAAERAQREHEWAVAQSYRAPAAENFRLLKIENPITGQPLGLSIDLPHGPRKEPIAGTTTNTEQFFQSNEASRWSTSDYYRAKRFPNPIVIDRERRTVRWDANAWRELRVGYLEQPRRLQQYFEQWARAQYFARQRLGDSRLFV